MRLLLSGSLIALVAVLFDAATLRQAYACSAGPDFDPVASSNVIVGGRFLRYQLRPDLRSIGEFIPVQVDFEVDHSYKGGVPAGTIVLIDRTSLSGIEEQGQRRWIASAGACGAFDEDPTGKYGIMGLSKHDDGTFGSGRLLWFYYGDDPSGEGYQRVVARLSSLPPTGFGIEVGPSLIAPAFMLGGLGAALITLSLLSRKRHA